jgi:hypothetical protein
MPSMDALPPSCGRPELWRPGPCPAVCCMGTTVAWTVLVRRRAHTRSRSWCREIWPQSAHAWSGRRVSLTRVLSTLATVPAGTLLIAAAYCLVLCLCELLPLERFLPPCGTSRVPTAVCRGCAFPLQGGRHQLLQGSEDGVRQARPREPRRQPSRGGTAIGRVTCLATVSSRTCVRPGSSLPSFGSGLCQAQTRWNSARGARANAVAKARWAASERSKATTTSPVCLLSVRSHSLDYRGSAR